MPGVQPGSIGITAAETGRYTAFTASLSGLESPPGTQIVWGVGLDVAGNRNFICSQLRRDDGWLFFLDDDGAFKEDLLMRLLSHDVDVVASLYLKKQSPFPVQAFVDDRYTPLDLSDCPTSGLVEVYAAGTAGMLISKHVIEAIEPPWFQNWNLGDDAWFCKRLRELGVPIYVDLDARIGHVTTAVIWPAVDDGRWATRFVVADGYKITKGDPTVKEEVPLPMMGGMGGLTNRPSVRPPNDEFIQPIGEDENGRPVFAQLPAEGPALPSSCSHVLSSFRHADCPFDCPGRQRDGSCLTETVRACMAAGVDWTAQGMFELDKDNFWVYMGPALERV